MQSAEVVLDVLHERGRRGLPLERLYRQLFNRQLYLVAYRKLYSNAGAMTRGVTGETVDGMSLEKIDLIIDMVRHERWRWSPVKRVRIPKKNGTRPLGLPGWSDKLLAEVVRMLLNAYYDVQFSDHSHGFRAGRGCHTTLQEIVDVWNGTNWFIEGDISKCFESLDHEVLMKTLGEKVHDSRFLRLVSGMLKAGYVEDWRWGATLSGAPQGGIASPVLSNIYLDRLDKYVEQQLLPLFNRGKRRAANPAYEKISSEIRSARRRGDPSGGASIVLAAPRSSQQGSQRSELPTPALRPVLRWHPPRIQRAEGRSAGDQANTRTVPAKGTACQVAGAPGTGLQRGQDAHRPPRRRLQLPRIQRPPLPTSQAADQTERGGGQAHPGRGSRTRCAACAA